MLREPKPGKEGITGEKDETRLTNIVHRDRCNDLDPPQRLRFPREGKRREQHLAGTRFGSTHTTIPYKTQRNLKIEFAIDIAWEHRYSLPTKTTRLFHTGSRQ